jgi:hypothetical protein
MHYLDSIQTFAERVQTDNLSESAKFATVIPDFVEQEHAADVIGKEYFSMNSEEYKERIDEFVDRIQRKQKLLLLKQWNRLSRPDPVNPKLVKLLRSKTAVKTKAKIFKALALNVKETQYSKLDKKMNTTNNEILALRNKVTRLEERRYESDNKKFKSKKKVVIDEVKLVPIEDVVAVPSAPPVLLKEAKIEQPTLVRLGLEKLLGTILNSNIITKEDKNKSEKLLQPKYPYFMHLLNVFTRKDEKLQDLIVGPPMSIIESVDLLYKQYNHILIRWAIFVVNKGVAGLEKKYR